MTIGISATSLKSTLDNANPNTLPDKFRTIKVGSVLRAGTTFLRKKTPVASSYSLATLLALVLPDDAKAHNIHRAYARTATAGQGELAVVAYGTTPATGQIAVGPNGDIVTLAADAITSVDVVYQPEKQDIQETTLAVAANVLTLPSQFTGQGVINLLEVEATIGTSVGKKIVLVPGAGAPAAGQARLNLDKSTVTFAAADAVTQARVKFSTVPTTDVDALLTGDSGTQ